MKQTDLLEWLDDTAVIRDLPPAKCIQQREWLKRQLLQLMQELDYLNISPTAIHDALHYYANHYREKAQDDILKDKDASC